MPHAMLDSMLAPHLPQIQNLTLALVAALTASCGETSFHQDATSSTASCGESFDACSLISSHVAYYANLCHDEAWWSDGDSKRNKKNWEVKWLPNECKVDVTNHMTTTSDITNHMTTTLDITNHMTNNTSPFFSISRSLIFWIKCSDSNKSPWLHSFCSWPCSWLGWTCWTWLHTSYQQLLSSYMLCYLMFHTHAKLRHIETHWDSSCKNMQKNAKKCKKMQNWEKLR